VSEAVSMPERTITECVRSDDAADAGTASCPGDGDAGLGREDIEGVRRVQQEAAELLGRMLAEAVASRGPSSEFDLPEENVPSLRFADGAYIRRGAGGWSAILEFVDPSGSRSSISLSDLETKRIATDRLQAVLAAIFHRERLLTMALPPGSFRFELAGTTIVVGPDDVERVVGGSRSPTLQEIEAHLDGFVAGLVPETMDARLRASPDTVRMIVAAVSRGMRFWPVAPGMSPYVH
jgi:hypothetical protein